MYTCACEDIFVYIYLYTSLGTELPPVCEKKKDLAVWLGESNCCDGRSYWKFVLHKNSIKNLYLY